MLTRRRSNVVELHVPHDVVEFILERLLVKTLLRLKCVSKKWKSTIESRRFQEQQFICSRQSGGPVLLVAGDDSNTDVQGISCDSCSMICHGSCDGLLWLSCDHKPNYVVNPATRWHQAFPLSNMQQFLVSSKRKRFINFAHPNLGFGKDKVSGTYKPVWLYNFSELSSTTCEIFDFSTNAWRYVFPDFLYRINTWQSPVYLDGSLYCLTLCKEPKVLSFDLHTETFQVICKAPFTPESDTSIDIRSILDNRLCLSEKKGLTQVIWSFDSSGGNKKWEKLCSLDLTKTRCGFEELHFPLALIAIVDKNKLLLQSQHCLEKHVIHDLHAKSYDILLLKTKIRGSPVYYYESLFSVSSN